MSCWLCGLVTVGGEGEAVEALTPQIVTLTTVAELLPVNPPADPFAVAACFIKEAAVKFATKEVTGLLQGTLCVHENTSMIQNVV